MKSQPHLLNDWKAKLWSRFFLLSVFASMYLNDLQRAEFYASIGLDARKFDIHVIRKTNQSSSRLFPVILNVDHKHFFEYLEICAQANLELIKTDSLLKPAIFIFFKKLPNYITLIFYLIKIFLLEPIDCQKNWNKIY